jgi:endonuclease G
LQSIGADGVLVPTSTWKAVYDPQADGTGVYVCQSTKRPRCAVVLVAALIRTVGIDPLPGLPEGIKATAMTLPKPEVSAYAPRQRQYPALLDSLPGPSETQ